MQRLIQLKESQCLTKKSINSLIKNQVHLKHLQHSIPIQNRQSSRKTIYFNKLLSQNLHK